MTNDESTTTAKAEGLKRMNGSKSYGPSGEERTSGEGPTRFAELTSAFPSPWPSPLGRGRIVRCLSGKPSAVSARQTSGAIRPGAECSLSPWERVRVRVLAEFDVSPSPQPSPKGRGNFLSLLLAALQRCRSISQLRTTICGIGVVLRVSLVTILMTR